MRIVKTLSGKGALKDNGVEFGSATYRIDISENHGVREGSGWLEADAEILQEAFIATELTLTRQDTGKDISILVTSTSSASTRAPCVLNGSPD
ncbi:hypothetical protein [Agrobacterium vitis]|uniref:hypothetical protein n=1 Tax=Agrobacterium vitis TaxID=373 RepID=UPI0012E976D8|nr:hypothetical protein [Agrobacterium vitis]MUZ64143.1 hypothetical protein [Agrobacterium vitis]